MAKQTLVGNGRIVSGSSRTNITSNTKKRVNTRTGSSRIFILDGFTSADGLTIFMEMSGNMIGTILPTEFNVTVDVSSPVVSTAIVNDSYIEIVIATAIEVGEDRKSTRLNSSHRCTSYAVFCLKKKKTNIEVDMLSETYFHYATIIRYPGRTLTPVAHPCSLS